MKVLFQRALDTCPDWEEVEAKDWDKIESGDVNAVCVQGLVFEGADQYAVEHLGESVRVRAIHNDPNDWKAGSRWAREVTFLPLAPDSRPEYGNAINTRISQKIYAEPEAKKNLSQFYGGDSFQNWDLLDLVASRALPGKWLANKHFSDLQKSRTQRTWREWTEGVPEHLIQSGKVIDQRSVGRYQIPLGTRTYYQTTSDDGGDGGLPNAVVERALWTDTSTYPSGTEASGNIGGNGVMVYGFWTPFNEPDSDAWPQTGVYRAQFDVVTAGADLVYGCRTIDGVEGGFRRMNLYNTKTLDYFEQDQAVFSGVGLRLATLTDPSWGTNGALNSNRFAVHIAAVRASGHGNQSMSIRVGVSDAFVDGPWPSA